MHWSSVVLAFWLTLAGSVAAADIIVGSETPGAVSPVFHNVCGDYKIDQRKNGDIIVTCPVSRTGQPPVVTISGCSPTKVRAVKEGDGARITCVPK